MLIWLIAIVLLVLGLGGIAAGPLMSRVEHPKYEVVRRDGGFEIRAYAPIIVAKAEVRGARKPAIEEGFRIIAGYIFGGNQGKMKIAMTAPVQQQAASAPADEPASERWAVSFVMPASWTLDTLPTPTDSRIELRALPAQRMVAITFSGSYSDRIIAEKTRELRDYAQRQGLAVSGGPLLAFYNPPWTLPMLRRNEVMLACAC